MKLSLSTIATALGSVTTIVGATQTIFTVVGTLMQAAEDAYGEQKGKGAAKKEAVLAAVAAFVAALGLSWTSLSGTISAWIDNVKSVYNAVNAKDTATAAA